MTPGPQAKSTRRATYWGPAMTESQYAVFHFDVQTMRMCEGQDAPLIFDSLAGAERHAREKVAAVSGLGCQILDSSGRVAGMFHDPEIYERFQGWPAAKRSLRQGIACLFAAAALIGLDAWFGFQLILGVFLGIRFLWAAAVNIIDGVSGLMEHNSKG